MTTSNSQLDSRGPQSTQDAIPSDSGLIDLLRKHQQMSVSEMAGAMQVTATAVRQRLNRLMGQGLVQRSVVREGRGRPSHRYELTQAGQRQGGSNFVDLAMALWQEIRAISDPQVRRGLLERISRRLAESYASQVHGGTVEERMQSLAQLLTDRRMPFEVQHRGELPVLQAHACPYPGLAEQDRGICAVERILFAELVGENLRLEQCRLDGASCCTFGVSQN
ncbi:MAG: hypothetical protein RIS70_1966 [Planctomycetota bacterium]|jgi:predicted ArsR family transcriptional regulator